MGLVEEDMEHCWANFNSYGLDYWFVCHYGGSGGPYKPPLFVEATYHSPSQTGCFPSKETEDAICVEVSDIYHYVNR